VELMATKKRTASRAESGGPSKQIGVRLSPEEYARLEKLSRRLPVGTFARTALLLGMEIIERQPGVLIGDEPKRR
jgi:hypothetical protein